jgi:hypothetical protein
LTASSAARSLTPRAACFSVKRGATGSTSRDESSLAELVRRRAPLLEPKVTAEISGSSGFELLGYRLRSVATGEPGLWCFGAETNAEHHPSVWLFVSRTHTQGLGWAYLTSLARQLQARPTERPHDAREAC